MGSAQAERMGIVFRSSGKRCQPCQGFSQFVVVGHPQSFVAIQRRPFVLGSSALYFPMHLREPGPFVSEVTLQ